MADLKSVDYLHALSKMGYSFALNELTSRIEVNGEPITDIKEAELRVKLRDAGLHNVNVARDAYITDAAKNSYHPVRLYFQDLQWDGSDHITHLCEHVTDTYRIFGTYLRRWLVGSIGKLLDQKQNFMLVLDGKQDLGKSYFVRWLCPLPEYFVEGSINTHDKDTWLRLASKWVWEVSELGATTRRSDREALKGFITQEEVTIRPPFGHHDLIKPAAASMIGTINEEGSGFLDDPTENRRYAVTEITGINHRYSQTVDLDGVWSQAYHMYKQGYEHRLIGKVKALQRQINVQYETGTPVSELFFNLFDIDDAAENWMPAGEIIKVLEKNGLKGNQSTNLVHLGKLMKTLNVTKKRVSKARVTCYRGVKKKVVRIKKDSPWDIGGHNATA